MGDENLRNLSSLRADEIDLLLPFRGDGQKGGGYVTFALSVRYWMTAKETDPQRQALVRSLLYHPAARLVSAPVFYVPAVLRRGTMLVTTAQKV